MVCAWYFNLLVLLYIFLNYLTDKVHTVMCEWVLNINRSARSRGNFRRLFFFLSFLAFDESQSPFLILKTWSQILLVQFLVIKNRIKGAYVEHYVKIVIAIIDNECHWKVLWVRKRKKGRFRAKPMTAFLPELPLSMNANIHKPCAYLMHLFLGLRCKTKARFNRAISE